VTGVVAAARARAPELGILGVGVAVRLTIFRSLPATLGYDFADHWRYVEWFTREWALPSIDTLRVAFHPPLFYFLSAQLVRVGAGPGVIQAAMVALGCLKLALIWLGLELFLPGRRTARLIALASAALLPVAVHVDALVSPEPLAAFLVATGLVPAALVLGGRTAHPCRLATLGGLALGLAVITKASSVAAVGALAVTVALQAVVDGRGGVDGRARRLVPWLAAAVVIVATCGWYVAWNNGRYGQPFVTSFEGWERRFQLAHNVAPAVFRRSPEFVTGWSAEIYDMPFYPSASLERPRFFPLLLASTFTDYYNHFFVPYRAGAPALIVYEKPMPAAVLGPARASMAGGTVLAAVAAAAWAAAAIGAARRRAWDAIFLLLVPLGALVAQLAFAVTYPHDWLGVVKGAYMQFAAPTLHATLGLGIAWLARRARPLAAVSLAALGAVWFYTLFCRTY
jgi:hypothetical protein